MDIFFLIRTLARAGAELQMISLAEGLAARGHRVRVGVFYHDRDMADRLERGGVEYINLDKSGRWDISGFLLRLARLLRNDPPDILHPYLGTANILSALLKPTLKTPRIVWSLRSSRLDRSNYGRAVRLSWALECKLARFADLIIANSQAGKDDAVEQGFPAQRTVIVPNGINCETFAPDAEAGAALRREWGVGTDEMLVGLVGRIDPVKGHEHFLHAAAMAATQCPDARFVCVGGDPQGRRQGLQELASGLGLEGRLLWAGQRQDMPAVYNALDLLCQASLSEGFPNVLCEAMACGTPCVATDVGDSADILENTGALVPPGDHDELLRGMTALLNTSPQERHDMGIASRSRIVQNYSLDTMVQRTETLLAEQS